VLAEAKRVEVEVGADRLEVRWVSGVRSALDSPSIEAGREVGSAEVRSLESGEPVAFDQPFWFAVASFRPDIRIVGEEEAARSSSSPSSGQPAPSGQQSWPRRGYLAPNS
jgi:hypothetical protein